MLTTILRRQTRRFRLLLKFAAFLPLFPFTALVSADEPPTIEEFPELIEACEPFQQFLFNNTMEITEEVDESEHMQRLSIAPAGSVILAFEENSRFICATIQIADEQPVQFLRRVLFIKPSLLIIDQIRDLPTPDSVAAPSFRKGIVFDEDLGFQVAAGDEEKSVRLTQTIDGEIIRTISAAVLADPGVEDLLKLDTRYKSPFVTDATVS
jgi:hypothetical protein